MSAIVGNLRVGSSYLEEQAKTYINDEVVDVERISKSGGWGENYCGQYAKVGRCENGHQYIKVIFCNKEWCENCREQAHNRRIARWLPKALTMQSFGYFIFTIPLEMREFYKDKKQLSRLRSYLRRRLKQIYPDIKALVRWHWFSEKNPCLYHPHLNLLVSCFEKLPKEKLERIKEDYKRALERFTGIKLNKKVDVYYHYYSPEGFKKEAKQKGRELTDEQAQELYQKVLWHKLRYITRATFIVYNRELAEKLKNYRNSVVWGRFPELPYEEVEKMAKQREVFSKVSQDVVMLENGYCPICGGKIRWLKGLYPGSLSFYGKEVGNGYFELPIKIRGSPRLPSKKQLDEIRHYRWLLKSQYWLEEWLEKELERKDIYD